MTIQSNIITSHTFSSKSASLPCIVEISRAQSTMKLLAHSNRTGHVYLGVGNTVYAIPTSTGTAESVRAFTSDKVSTSTIYALSLDRIHEKYLVVGYENKALLCWDVDSGDLVGSRQMRKKPTAVLATTWAKPSEDKKDYSVALVSDKAGEIWAVRMPDLAQELLVAGHTTSVVTDLTFSASQHRVISSDRDEKLRISSFPDLETIHGYCLGHTSVVSSTCTLKDDVTGQDYIVSTGWDHRLFLWNMNNAEVLDEFAFKDVPPPSSSNGPAAAAVAKRGREEGDDSKAENVGGEEEIDEQEKEYNEQEAGNYPFKIASNQKSLFAVIFKDDAAMKVFEAKENKITLLQEITLPAAPLDVEFINSNTLSVLLPKPDILQFYSIDNGVASQVTSSHLTTAYQTELQAVVGDSFTQAVISSGLGFDNETGMKKHALDRPFNKDEDINFNAKKGAKRSKKN